MYAITDDTLELFIEGRLPGSEPKWILEQTIEGITQYSVVDYVGLKHNIQITLEEAMNKPVLQHERSVDPSKAKHVLGICAASAAWQFAYQPNILEMYFIKLELDDGSERWYRGNEVQFTPAELFTILLGQEERFFSHYAGLIRKDPRLMESINKWHPETLSVTERNTQSKDTDLSIIKMENKEHISNEGHLTSKENTGENDLATPPLLDQVEDIRFSPAIEEQHNEADMFIQEGQKESLERAIDDTDSDLGLSSLFKQKPGKRFFEVKARIEQAQPHPLSKENLDWIKKVRFVSGMEPNADCSNAWKDYLT